MFFGNGDTRPVRSRYPRCANAARTSANDKQIIFKFSHAIFPLCHGHMVAPQRICQWHFFI
jgi:hypothetical protein